MKIPIALVMALSVSQPGLSAEEPVAGEKKLAVKFERYGGFAGFHDNISIFADFSYVLATPDEKTVIQGALSDDLQKRLTELLAHFGEWIKATSDGPGVADGMETRIEIHGTGEVTADGDLQELNRLLHEILTAANSGKKVPKASR